MAKAAADWKYDQLHEERPFHDGSFEKSKLWTKERTEATPFHYKDGVTILVSTTDLTPDSDFLSPREVVNSVDTP